MTEGLLLHALDSAVLVRAPQRVLRELRTIHPDGAPASGATRHELALAGTHVLVDGRQVSEVPAHGLELQYVLTALNAVVLADCTSVAVHAGVVASGGLAMAFPGISGAGKSTLTAACLRTGMSYVSDEALVLDGGRARPYAKPLSLSAWSLAALGLRAAALGLAERPVASAELATQVETGPVPVGHVVLLDRRPGAAALRPLARADAAMSLLGHSFNHFRDRARAVEEVAVLVRAAECWRLAYDGPADGAQALAALAAR